MDHLLTEFPEHTYDQWHAAAEALLKGASFEQKLVSKTYEDITIQPIYRREDIADFNQRNHPPGSDSLIRGSKTEGFLKTGWAVSQELKANTPTDLNAIIHEGINGGQSELNIVVGCGHDGCCKGGASLKNTTDISTALSGVQLDAISTNWQAGPSTLPVAALFIAAAEQAGVSPDNIRASFENDPLAEWIRHGKLRQSLATRYDQMAALTDYAIQHAPQIRTICATGDIWHNSGATSTQELGYTIATAVNYIEEMKSRGIAPSDVFPHIRLRLAVGSDYFMEIAKIRAARWLWSKVAAAYGVQKPSVHVHASTSKWNKSLYDGHTNMLRVTSEAFAAVVAGADSIHIGPFDEIAGKSDEFSRRISRNLHTILRKECGLDQVIDPAGGSTYIEWLTDQIAEKSWAIFQKIEQAGGMTAAITQGTVQQSIETVCKAKFQNIRRRKDKIVGSNMYPDLKGKKLMVHAPECKAAKSPPCTEPFEPVAIARSTTSAMVEQAIIAAKLGASKYAIAAAIGNPNNDASLSVPTLAPHRAAEEYEALRDASAAYATKNGAAPTILQLNIGPSGKFRLRADWTAAFFEAAGFAIDGTRDFLTHHDAITALAQSPATIAVITSDDATYLESVEPLAIAAKSAKPNTHLLVAGAPGQNESAWRNAGIDDFVNIRSNNYELNAQLLKVAGVL